MKVVVKKYGTEESQDFFVADADKLLALLPQAFNCHGLLRNRHNQVVGDASYPLEENEVLTWHPAAATAQAGGSLAGATGAQTGGVAADTMAELVEQMKELGHKLDAAKQPARIAVPRASECGTELWNKVESLLPGTVDLSKDKRAPCCIMLEGVPHDTTKFEWNPPNNEDAAANIEAFTAHLNQHVLPEGVHAWPVQRVNWLKATITCSNGDMIDIGENPNRTDYILVLLEGLEVVQELHANKVTVSSDHIEQLLDYVVGLYEAKTSDTLQKNLPKGRRQAILEYLAVNQLHTTSHKIVVVLGDGNAHHCVHPDPDRPDRAIHVAGPARLQPVSESAPARRRLDPHPNAITQQFVKQLLANARDAAVQYLKGTAWRAQGPASLSRFGSDNDSEGHGPQGGSSDNTTGTDGGAGPPQRGSQGGGPATRVAGARAAQGGSNKPVAGEEEQSGHVDEGLLEAAKENAAAHAFLSLLNDPWMMKGLGVKPGEKLAYTPVTAEQYAASFDFGFDRK